MSIYLQKALMITLVGVVLVFVGILLLWGIMEALVRLTSSQKKQDKKPEQEDESAIPAPQQAAAAAVAAALLLSKDRITLPQLESSALSPWQSAHRGQQHSTRK
jgi:Na+-transporting methylmalonyl-CoA/oxaloacetate decarboxylase gamma subunit